jgi:hypothetical protein
VRVEDGGSQNIIIQPAGQDVPVQMREAGKRLVDRFFENSRREIR